MSAAALLLQQAHGDGLELSATAAGKIKVRGPREAVARWTPIIVENKSALLAKLSAAPSPADARAAVEKLLDEMAAENERRREWWKASPFDRDGNVTIRSILTGATDVILLPKRRRP
jgi:hypothetical protein